MQSIFRVTPTGIGVMKNRILWMLIGVCEMTGYKKEELIGKNSGIFYMTQEALNTLELKYRQITERGTGVVETRWMKRRNHI
jgi:PAS domain S-box-containing protein